VVEDSPTQAQALGAALEAAGYGVTLAASGDEALHHIKADGFDVVVSDVVMPGEVDGFELCRRIKAGPLKDTPVVLFTALDDPLDIVQGLECGADNFFTKSHGTEQLLRRIKMLLETREARSQVRARLGVKVFFLGREFTITSDREQIIDLLMSTFEDAVYQNRELVKRETELARSHQALRGLYQLAVGLNEANSEAQVLEIALDRTLELPGVQAGWVSLREGKSGFRVAASRNLPPALQRPDALTGDCLCRRRLLAGDLGAVADVVECERLRQAKGDTGGLRFHAVIPLWVRDQVVGVMNLAGPGEGLFTEEDLTVLHGVGNEIAVALERATLQGSLEGLVAQRTAALRAEVAERQQAEAALRLSDSILQQVGNVVVVADRDGLIRYASPSVTAVLGYAPEAVLGDGWWERTCDQPDQRSAEREAMARAARGETQPRSMPYERAVPAADGSRKLILWSESKGPGDLLVSVGVDMTDTRRLEEQFRQAQKMEAVGRLAGGIAHDFNNLLTAITGYADLLREDTPEGDPRRQDLDEIARAGHRAAGLTRQLLAFSRQQVLQPRVVDLNEAVAGMDKMLRRIIGEDIDLVTVLQPDLGRVRADPGQIEQVVVNLAVNSRDAMPDGGKLTIETADVDLSNEHLAARHSVTPGAYVMLAVTDTGTGIPEEARAHIFEPFFTTKGPGKGTGLGLATVYGIVRQSEGQILVYSEPGRGTTFKIYMPRVEDTAEHLIPTGTQEPPRGGSETILLVEDEDGVRNLAKQVLERRGYTVLVASDGDEARRVCQEHSGPIHLLLTDVVMPGLSGPQSAEELRRERPEMKVLFMSGYPDRAMEHHKAFEPGVPFLPKPFAPDALMRKVREALEQT
jgi:PAS domain S-box-containing protein